MFRFADGGDAFCCGGGGGGGGGRAATTMTRATFLHDGLENFFNGIALGDGDDGDAFGEEGVEDVFEDGKGFFATIDSNVC